MGLHNGCSGSPAGDSDLIKMRSPGSEKARFVHQETHRKPSAAILTESSQQLRSLVCY